MEGNQSRRIDFVDLTKGVCIILVVIAHVGGAFEQLDTNSMLSCFRMPLYFFISGVFFKSYEGLFGFILRKINKLIIPFLFFYLSAFLMKYIVWKIAPGVFQLPVSWNELLVVFHGHDLIKFNPPIWFLLALFNCNILFYLIHFLREKHLPIMFAVTLLIGCTGFYLGKLQIELPLYIDVSMTALPFYVAGFWIRRYNFFLYPLRVRAGFTETGALDFPSSKSKEELIDIVRRERRCELALEGLRYTDIIRWRIAEDVLNGNALGKYTGESGSIMMNGYRIIEKRKFDKNKHYLWPVPEAERLLNKNLGQNSNW